jgi:hypothetical protein
MDEVMSDEVALRNQLRNQVEDLEEHVDEVRQVTCPGDRPAIQRLRKLLRTLDETRTERDRAERKTIVPICI